MISPTVTGNSGVSLNFICVIFDSVFFPSPIKYGTHCYCMYANNSWRQISDHWIKMFIWVFVCLMPFISVLRNLKVIESYMLLQINMLIFTHVFTPGWNQYATIQLTTLSWEESTRKCRKFLYNRTKCMYSLTSETVLPRMSWFSLISLSPVFSSVSMHPRYSRHTWRSCYALKYTK